MNNGPFMAKEDFIDKFSLHNYDKGFLICLSLISIFLRSQPKKRKIANQSTLTIFGKVALRAASLRSLP